MSRWPAEPDGIHIRDGGPEPGWFRQPGFLVSAAFHRVEDLPDLAEADYIVLAPIFQPISKAGNGTVLGIEALREAARRTNVPVLALGGITRENEQNCVEAGAAGIAGISYFDLAP